MTALGHFQPLSIHPPEWLLTATSGHSSLSVFRPEFARVLKAGINAQVGADTVK